MALQTQLVFIQDACCVALIIIVFFFLDVEIEKPDKKLSIKDEFQWLLNPAAIGFNIQMFVAGVTIGSVDTYLYIFAQETLGASTTFLGYMQFTSSMCSFPAFAFSKYVFNYCGHMNTMCLCQIIYIGRLVAIGLTYSSPPYPFIVYAALESFSNLYMVAIISYTSVIGPQSLIATAISIGSCYDMGCWKRNWLSSHWDSCGQI